MDAPAPDTGKSAKPAKSAKPKGKAGGIIRILLLGLGVVVGAGAGGFGAILAAAKLGIGGGSGGGNSHVEAPPPAAHGPVSYVEIDNAFTSNLVDTGRYLQLRIAVSTAGGELVTKAIDLHKPALISTVLAVLGEQSETDVADRAAKDRLRAKLKLAINKMLQENGEKQGVEEVFFTSLVVQ
ncbi:MAG: flagellar basal body-associated FliL family protein [Polymorphobacter sp.]